MKLTPAEHKAMKDFWTVYDAHYDTIVADSMAEAAAHPEFGPVLRAVPAAQMEEQNRRSRALMRDAVLDGAWEPYLADLRSQGAVYAQIGVSFQGWFDLISVIRTQMARHLITAYGQDPERLGSAMDGLNKLIDVAMAVIGDEYLRIKEKLLGEHGERLAALRSIDTAITSSLDLGLTLTVVLDQIITHLRVDAAAVLLLDPRTQTLEYAAGRGFRSSPAHPPRLRLGEDLPGRAALERRTLSLANPADGANASAWSRLLASENFIAGWCAPLLAKGEVKGVLEILHRARCPQGRSGQAFSKPWRHKRPSHSTTRPCSRACSAPTRTSRSRNWPRPPAARPEKRRSGRTGSRASFSPA
jgi:GAF domain/Protoglobin